MRVLSIMVDGQTLSPINDLSGIVAGSKGYLKCQFTFKDSNWSSMKKIAVFDNGDKEEAVVLDKAGCCEVPDIITDKTFFRICLVGVNKNKRIKTERLLINQRR